MTQWISIPGWRRFQHYDPAKRQPPWIKTYVELLADHDYLELSEHRALLLHRLWLEYASTRCRLPLDTRSLSRRLFLRVTSSDLDSLRDAGFIDYVASAALAEGYHDASPRARATETETETEVVDVSLTSTTDHAGGRGNGWVEDLSSYTGCRLVRGDVGTACKYDPLGKDRPPRDWPHERPTRDEILKALRERAAVA